MDRADWRKERRRINEVRMDTLFAPTYDDEWGHINETHRAMLLRLMDLCPPACTILDAACGTGKYWPLILSTGRAVRGIDQSAGMLRQAQRKFPHVSAQKLGLQDLYEVATVDGITCIDAMENVFPEDWPAVLGNFRRALTSRGHLYFTVEIASKDDVEGALHAGQEMGLPVVEGEWAHEGWYHYYPEVEQVRLWAREAGFEVLDEMVGDGYHHFIARRAKCRDH